MLTPGSRPIVAGLARPVATSTNCIGSPAISRPPAPTSWRGTPSSESVAGPHPCVVSSPARYSTLAPRPGAAFGRPAECGADVVGVHEGVVPEREHTAAERQVGTAARSVPHVVVERVEQRLNRCERGAQAGRRLGGGVAPHRCCFFLGVATAGRAFATSSARPDDVAGDVAHLKAGAPGGCIPSLARRATRSARRTPRTRRVRRGQRRYVRALRSW